MRKGLSKVWKTTCPTPSTRLWIKSCLIFRGMRALPKSFGHSISEVCRKDLPRLTVDSPLHELIKTAVEGDLAVLPICDEDGRLTGLVRSVDLMKGIGTSIGFNPEQELPKA